MKGSRVGDRFLTEKKQHIVFIQKRVTHFYNLDGELICQRKFCRMCLKQNYDIKIEEIASKTDWVCPFCQVIFLIYYLGYMLLFKVLKK